MIEPLGERGVFKIIVWSSNSEVIHYAKKQVSPRQLPHEAITFYLHFFLKTWQRQVVSDRVRTYASIKTLTGGVKNKRQTAQRRVDIARMHTMKWSSALKWNAIKKWKINEEYHLNRLNNRHDGKDSANDQLPGDQSQYQVTCRECCHILCFNATFEGFSASVFFLFTLNK